MHYKTLLWTCRNVLIFLYIGFYCIFTVFANIIIHSKIIIKDLHISRIQYGGKSFSNTTTEEIIFVVEHLNNTSLGITLDIENWYYKTYLYLNLERFTDWPFSLNCLSYSICWVFYFIRACLTQWYKLFTFRCLALNSLTLKWKLY